MADKLYNFIYSKIVNEPNDIVGLIAYGVYKRKKVEFITAYKEEHGVEPSDCDLDAFHQTCHSHIEEYKLAAIQVIDGAINDILQAHRGSLDEEFRKHKDVFEKECRAHFHKKNREAVWRNIWTGVVSSFASVIIIALIAFNDKYDLIGKVQDKWFSDNSTQSEEINK